MTGYRRPISDADRAAAAEARQATLDKLHTQLRDGILALNDPQAWQEWLRFSAQFHRYSMGNSMLIMLQDPKATHVAGYQAFKAMGRQVRRGETGIKVLAPIARRDPLLDDAGNPQRDDQGRVRYRTHVVATKPVTVFDALSRVLLRDSGLGSWVRLCLVCGVVASVGWGVELTGRPVDEMYSEVEGVLQEFLDLADLVGVAVDEEFGLCVAGEGVDGDGQGEDSVSGGGADEDVDALSVAAGGAVEVAVVDWVDDVGVAGVCRAGGAVDDLFQLKCRNFGV